jgi:hypothetical protein
MLSILILFTTMLWVTKILYDMIYFHSNNEIYLWNLIYYYMKFIYISDLSELKKMKILTYRPGQKDMTKDILLSPF